jgi:hypothetical protein
VLVVGAAVELGDQALRSPEHVDLVAVDVLVDLGTREAVAVDEREERVLEDRARRGLRGVKRARPLAR